MAKLRKSFDYKQTIRCLDKGQRMMSGLEICVFCLCVETRAGLVDAGEVTMTEDLGLGVVLLQGTEQGNSPYTILNSKVYHLKPFIEMPSVAGSFLIFFVFRFLIYPLRR